jgi:hypothetical protein
MILRISTTNLACTTLALEASAASVYLPKLGPAFCIATLNPLPADPQVDSAPPVVASKKGS